MAPPSVVDIVQNELTRVDSGIRQQILAMIEVQINTRFPQLDVLMSAYSTRAQTETMIKNRISHLATKRDLESFVTQSDLERKVDERSTLVAENKVYQLLGTQTGLQQLMQRQRVDLEDHYKTMIVDIRKDIEKEASNVIQNSFKTDTGSKLVEEIRRETKPGFMFYTTVITVAGVAGWLGSVIGSR